MPKRKASHTTHGLETSSKPGSAVEPLELPQVQSFRIHAQPDVRAFSAAIVNGARPLRDAVIVPHKVPCKVLFDPCPFWPRVPLDRVRP